MKKNTFGYEEISTICNKLTEQGKIPSIHSVKSSLGGGSPNRILGYLRQWHKEHELSSTVDNDLSAEFKHAVLAECARKLNTVKSKLQAQINDREAQITELQEILATNETQLEELTTALETLKKETEKKYFDYERKLAAANEQIIVRTEHAHEITIKTDKQLTQLREELLKMQEAKHQSDIKAAASEAKSIELEKRLMATTK